MGYARKDVEKTKKLAKKFVRYQEGAELYSIGLTKLHIAKLNGRICGAKRSHSVFEQPNCYQSV